MKRALALAALLLAVGCGVKALPRPPIEPGEAEVGPPAANEDGGKR